MHFYTIEDYQSQLKGAKVLVRVDTNATLESGVMPFTERVKAAFETIQYLVNAGASVVVAAHNGREGELGYVSLGPLYMMLKKEHPKELPELVCPGNTYDEERKGLNSDAIKAIKGLKPGQVLVLENVRFLVQETAKMKREEFVQEKFVKDLLEAGIQYFVMDGFSVAHRAQMSVVGFAQIPNLAGLCIKKELIGSSRVIELLEHNKTGKGKVTFVLGGAKIQDYLELIEKALEQGTVGKILTGGLLGQICMFAKGYDLGPLSKKPLDKKDSKGKSIWDEKDRVAKLLEKYADRFVLPEDVAYEMPDKSRRECSLTDIPAELKEKGAVLDIGSKTITRYMEIVYNSQMVYWKGPLGAFDRNPAFGDGSKKVLQVLVNNTNIFSVMGGGDTGQMIESFGVKPEQIGYMSLAGGALIELLAGKKLPGIAILEESYKKFPLQK